MAGKAESKIGCLIVLVGFTADASKQAQVKTFLSANSSYQVIVPDLPQTRGIRCCADWLDRYLLSERVFERHEICHFLNYISGGYIFRSASSRLDASKIGRVIYVRGPIQEAVPRALVRKYTWPILRFTQGRMITDLASNRLKDIPQSNLGTERGLVIETSPSAIARDLGLNAHSVPEGAWDVAKLLPGATDVLRVPESHDDVYSSPTMLGNCLAFFDTGRFASNTILS